jgi:hypothetical protein
MDPCRGGREEPPQLWSRGSLLHPQEKGPKGGVGDVNSSRGGIGTLLECVFWLTAPTF